jgi:NAD+ diphosphatase
MLFNEQPELFSLAYDPQPCAPQDTVLCFLGDQVLLRPEGDGTRLPLWREVMPLAAGEAPLHAMNQGARRLFLLQAQQGTVPPKGLAFESVRVFRSLLPQEDSFLLVSVYHLAMWYAKHRFCGVCGSNPAPAPHERALVCPQCGQIQFPVISPAIIVAVTDGDRLLLARNAYGTFRHYSLIAGFVEVGETLEQTVAREVREETDLRVRDVRYIASQPWGLSQSMMIGFHARLVGPADITLQTSELADAGWYRADELPEHAGVISIAYSLIDLFKQGVLR